MPQAEELARMVVEDQRPTAEGRRAEGHAEAKQEEKGKRRAGHGTLSYVIRD
ncbi:MAG: hypothetical protein AAB016_04115 [candidate division NC10 bacterium]